MTGASLYVAMNSERKTRSRSTGPKAKVQAASGKRARLKLGRARRVIAFKAGRRGRLWGQRPGRSVSTYGGRLKNVVKSRFVRTSFDARRHLADSLRYYQERERADWEPERKYFDRERTGLDRGDIRKEIEASFGRAVAFHKVILSPGDNSVNLTDYVRKTMGEWEKELGYDLNYWAVEHYNTDHYHAHLIIGGRSADGRRDVRLDRFDLTGLREIGNDYLARERLLDRDLDRLVDLQLDTLDKRLFDLDIEKDLLRNPYQDWRDQVDLGLRTNYDYSKEWRELGLNRVFELGRPFQALDRKDPDFELLRSMREDDPGKDKQEPSRAERWDRDLGGEAYDISRSDPAKDDTEHYGHTANHEDWQRFTEMDEAPDERPAEDRSGQSRESDDPGRDRDDEERRGRGGSDS